MACHKKAYLNWQHAKNDARDISGISKDRHAEPYECSACGRIHVGTRWTGKYGDSVRYQPKGKRRDKRVIVLDDRD